MILAICFHCSFCSGTHISIATFCILFIIYWYDIYIDILCDSISISNHILCKEDFICEVHIFLNNIQEQERQDMAIRLPRVMHVKQIFRRVAPNSVESSSVGNNIPRGYIPVYVGEEQKKRYVVPISYLNEPSFQRLLSKAEEEFGYDHPMGGLTIPCRDKVFTDLTSCLAEN
ncbi:indole-3-acetic acid-induced protein ARG7-like [Benincasa hispida]|uniref:indole-3-acetic acid-induced protein ARG7-like n=1 Tax=Benincasa hispida TaxID=102211 RepID=UPI0019019765|nr:indole-3-acetic acid-induced protein ARG7-like [Benincasa hispida]